MLVVYPNTDSVYPITGALGSHSTSFMIMAILQITAWSTTIDYRRDVACKHSLPPVQGFTCHGVMFLVPIPGYGIFSSNWKAQENWSGTVGVWCWTIGDAPPKPGTMRNCGPGLKLSSSCGVHRHSLFLMYGVGSPYYTYIRTYIDNLVYIYI